MIEMQPTGPCIFRGDKDLSALYYKELCFADRVTGLSVGDPDNCLSPSDFNPAIMHEIIQNAVERGRRGIWIFISAKRREGKKS